MSKDLNKISPTAIMCAQFRKDYTNLPYAKEISEELDKLYAKGEVNYEKNFTGMLNIAIKTLSKIYPEILIMPVILELASGFSTRSLELNTGDEFFIESDLEKIIKLKEKIVKNIKKEKISKNHHFMSLNPLDYESFKKAGELYQESQTKKPLAIINEGFFMYLDKDEQKVFRDNIAQFLEDYSPEGSWLTPDFIPERLSKTNFNPIINWIRDIVKKRSQKKTGRQFTYFKDEEEIQKFLNEGGLSGRLRQFDLVQNLSSIKKIKIDPNKIRDLERLYGVYCINRGK